tara:strand:- start:4540 stop:4791 length:252 start_codon:yes stop_codon:yes gene_type:complete
MYITQVYLIGIFILITAIITNSLASHIGLLTWYDFGSSFFTDPIQTFSDTKWISLFWLFILYPIILGIGAIFGEKCFAIISTL